MHSEDDDSAHELTFQAIKINNMWQLFDEVGIQESTIRSAETRIWTDLQKNWENLHLTPIFGKYDHSAYKFDQKLGKLIQLNHGIVCRLNVVLTRECT